MIMGEADPDLAMMPALGSAFGDIGRKCMASSQFVGHETAHETSVVTVVTREKVTKVGHALDATIHLGPAANQKLAANLTYADLSRAGEAELACGGERMNIERKAFRTLHGVFINTASEMRISREGMSEPLTSAIRVGSCDGTFPAANDTESVWISEAVPRSLVRFTHFRRNAQTGMMTISLSTIRTGYHGSFGGRGNSSCGPCEQGRVAARFCATVKTANSSARTPD